MARHQKGAGTGPRSGAGAASNDNGARYFIIIALLVLGVFAFFPLLGAGLTTNDDMILQLNAGKDLLTRALPWAKLNGRFHVFFQQILIKVPYLFESFAYYKTASLAPIALNVALLGIVVRQFTRSYYLSALTAAVFLSFLSNMWEHYLLTSFPFLYTTGINFLLLSLVFFHKNIEKQSRVYTVLSSVFFFLALLTYELFLTYLVLFLFLSVVYEGRGPGQGRAYGILRRMLPYLYPVALYLAAYFAFRYFFPSTYMGSKMGAFTIPRFLRVIYQFSVSSLPTYVYYHYQPYLSAYSGAFDGHRYSLIHIIRNARAEWAAKFIVLASLVFFILRARPPFSGLRSFLALGAVSAALFLMPPLLPAMTETYMSYVEKGLLAHTVTYFSYFGAVLFFASSVIYLNQLLSKNRVISFFYMLTVALGAGTIGMVTDYSNSAVSLSQSQSALKWRTFDYFLASEEFKAVPDGSVIYAPSLWQQIGFAAVYDAYWTDYISLRTGRNVIVTDRKEDMEAASSAGRPMYFLKYSQEKKDPNQFMVFSPITGLSRDGAAYSENAFLYTYSKYKRFLLFFMLDTERAGFTKVSIDNNLNVTANGFFAGVVDKTGNKEPFLKTVISGERINLDSVSLSNYTDFTGTDTAFKLVWGEGCNELEGDSTHNWRWSAPSCVLTFHNDTGGVMSATVEMKFATGYKEFSNMRIDSSLFSDNLKVNSEGVEYKRVVKVPPGRYAIRFSSDAPRVKAPLDPRVLVFKFINFKAI
ncbi:MAG: hypothetical protein HY956_02470 [Deltaproteobacteria bacterium]|nr:hypothetical protein [Deltaproteobacteria bacterium]